jgi:hypothetical protein
MNNLSIKKLSTVLILAGFCAYSQSPPAACGPMLSASKNSACDAENAFLSCYTLNGRAGPVTLGTKSEDILLVKVNGTDLVRDQDYRVIVSDVEFSDAERAAMQQKDYHPMAARYHCPGVVILKKSTVGKGVETFQVFYFGQQ